MEQVLKFLFIKKNDADDCRSRIRKGFGIRLYQKMENIYFGYNRKTPVQNATIQTDI